MKPFSLRLKTALLAPLPVFALAYFVPTSSSLFPVLIFAPVIVECNSRSRTRSCAWWANASSPSRTSSYTLMAAVPLGVVLLVLVGIYGRVHF